MTSFKIDGVTHILCGRNDFVTETKLFRWNSGVQEFDAISTVYGYRVWVSTTWNNKVRPRLSRILTVLGMGIWCQFVIGQYSLPIDLTRKHNAEPVVILLSAPQDGLFVVRVFVSCFCIISVLENHYGRKSARPACQAACQMRSLSMTEALNSWIHNVKTWRKDATQILTQIIWR